MLSWHVGGYLIYTVCFTKCPVTNLTISKLIPTQCQAYGNEHLYVEILTAPGMLLILHELCCHLTWDCARISIVISDTSVFFLVLQRRTLIVLI